jgi:cytochrome c-type biogenesis protein
MTNERPPAPLPETPSLPDEPDDLTADHGRIGYGRLGRFTPLLLGLLLIGAIVAIWWVQRDTSPEGSTPGSMTGEQAPDVSLTLLDGTPLRLSDLRGKVVVLNFWASWCTPCRQEMPELQSFWDEARQSGEATEIVGIGVRTDRDEDAETFVREGKYTYPIGRDTETDEPGVGPIQAAFGIPEAYPATVVVRPDGTVDRYHLGPLNRPMLRYMVNAARADSG